MASEFLQVRRRPTRVRPGNLQRNSNLVRASVLETALELGFSQNSTVANWIFNNPLSEEVEEFHPELDKLDTVSVPTSEVTEATTPTYTSGSNSISDESSSLNSPGNNASSAAVTAIQVHMHKPSLAESPHVHFGEFSSDQLQLFAPFALSPHDAHHGEIRDDVLAKPPRDNERSHSQDNSLHHIPTHEDPRPGSADAGYASEGQYLSKGKARKGKDKSGKSKNSKGSRPDAPNDSKTSEKDADYASDGGYLSASSSKSQGKSPNRVKSRAMAFFRRRTRKSASDDEDEDVVPPVPALPVLPRPSSPKLLERRAVPSSPTRSGFSPLTLNLTSPPASPPRRQVSKSPPLVHSQATLSQRSDHISIPQQPISPLVASTSAPTILTPSTTAATFPLPPSIPGTPLSAASFSTGSAMKALSAPSSRQHLSLPPPTPPPTLPLPQPPQSSSISPDGMLPSVPAAPSTRSRRGASSRLVPVVPPSPGSPLTPRGPGSPLRPLLSPRPLPPAALHPRNCESGSGFEGDQLSGKEFTRRQRSATPLSAGFGSTPAFLQRRIQHGLPSPQRPPPDAPPPAPPCPAPCTRPRTPVGSPSKFHEHFSSVSSVPLSQILSTPTSVSPSRSATTLSGSSSGLSVRSSHVSSFSGRSDGLAIQDSLKGYSRPTTSASSVSEISYGQPIISTFGKPVTDRQSDFSGQSDISSSIYSQKIYRDSNSVTTTCDGDVDDAAPKSSVDEEDDASVYPSDDKTAGRRTMYLVEHGESGDEIVIAGSHYWDDHEMLPPLPPLPPMPTLPGPGYF